MGLLWPQPRKIKPDSGRLNSGADPQIKILDSAGDAEFYTLKILQDGVFIEAGSPCGAFRAQTTLKQLRQIYGAKIPCMEIEDAPDFSKRGFLLDISRCKVPTMETLFGLIDLLADLKYNQLYLYVEHTFAYHDHETVWKDASPLTAAEVRTLDDYCAARFIELVPVQNSLGHMERWLNHPEYKHLAECPKGFYYEPHKKQYAHGTTLAPTDETLAFLDRLYTEYLPNFRSKNFVTGCDEPWELGFGRSKERVEREGFAVVYADWLRRLDKLAQQHGRRMFYFADIIQNHPEIAGRLPANAVPMIWGYYPGSIPGEDCEKIAATSPDFYMVPGVNCWMSFAGRLDYAVHNAREAAALGKKYGACGYVNTSWGDAGNHYAWASMYPGILLGAAEAWNTGSGSVNGLSKVLDRFVFDDQSPGLGQALLDLVSADHIYQIGGWPDGFPHHLSFRGFFSNAGQMEQFLDGHVTAQDAEQAHDRFTAAREKTAAVNPGNREGETAKQEMIVAADMALFGIERAARHLEGRPSADFRPAYERFATDYAAVWLLRARTGGLSESLGHIFRNL